MNMSTAACFPGACVEKTWFGEFGGDGKDRWEESKRGSKTEVLVSGQLELGQIIEGQREPNAAHQGFRRRTALAAHGHQRH